MNIKDEDNSASAGYMLFGPLKELADARPTTTTQPQIADTNKTKTGSMVIIPPYLQDNVDLWVWDWDDTLIDSSAYVRHSMSKDSIKNLQDSDLDVDFPYWRFFKTLVETLVEHGRRVGIASFGTYTIIRAYMDRIFGHDQKYFIRANIHAACPDLDCVRDYRQMPLNKNPYIQRMMNHYRIRDHGRVILFDDVPSNIADAKRLGVIAVQMGVYNKENAKWEPNLAGLFGPSTLLQFGSRFAQSCKKEARVGGPFSFGAIGDRKSWKYSLQSDRDDFTRVLNPNFKTSHFIDLPDDLPNDLPTSSHDVVLETHKPIPGIINKNDNDNNNNNNNTNEKSKLISSKSSSNTRPVIEGMRNSGGSCMSCQNPLSTYVLIGMFGILILILFCFVKWG